MEGWACLLINCNIPDDIKTMAAAAPHQPWRKTTFPAALSVLQSMDMVLFQCLN